MHKHHSSFIEDLIGRARACVNGALPDTSFAAQAAKVLTLHEIQEGGPYSFDSAPDLYANLGIACFLSACDVHLPKLDRFISANMAKARKNEIDLYALLQRLRNEKSQTPLHEGAQFMLAKIEQVAFERFADLAPDIYSSVSQLFQSTVDGNPDAQMPLISYFMREALGSRGRYFDDTYIASHGFANICFWTSFIVYDDFWDEDEKAQPSFLPAANLLARHYIDYFSTLPVRHSLRSFLSTLFDELDAANAWEIGQCRMIRDGFCLQVPQDLPRYGDFDIKFYPAAGHVAGPAAMLSSLGVDVGSEDFDNLIEYFKHYLIAMQINDDAHDWKEDLRRGHISTAVYLLLSLWRERHPDRRVINIVSDMHELEELFWFEILHPLCRSALSHTELSREALLHISLIENPAPLEQFIIRNERVAYEALSCQSAGNALLREFANS